jgi:hypothetical protein
MRHLLLAVALLAALLALPVTAGARTKPKPSIMVTRVLPLTVKGSGFVAGERVKVVVRIPEVYRKTVRAGRRGRFTLLMRVPAGKCVTIRVAAIGSKGSRASTMVPATCVP